MPYPNTAVLPPAPSKFSDPTNFVTESVLYLDALPQLVSEFNALVAYLNTLKPNNLNMGGIAETNYAVPTPIHNNLTSLIVPTGTGVGYVSSIDTLLTALQVLSTEANNYGIYGDNLVSRFGSVGTFTGGYTATTLSPAPTRSQSQATFNTTMTNLVASINVAMNNLYKYCDTLNTLTTATDDAGALTDGTISVTTDAGALTDATITN